MDLCLNTLLCDHNGLLVHIHLSSYVETLSPLCLEVGPLRGNLGLDDITSQGWGPCTWKLCLCNSPQGGAASSHGPPLGEDTREEGPPQNLTLRAP